MKSTKGHNQIAAASEIGRHLGRHVSHAGVHHIARARTVEVGCILGKALAKAVVERQDVMAIGKLPPVRDHGGEALGLSRREVVGLVEVSCKVVELPLVGVEGFARRMVGDGLPALMPEAAMAKLRKILRAGLRRDRWIVEARPEAHALERHLCHAVDLSRQLDTKDVEQRRYDVADVAKLMAQLAAHADGHETMNGSRMPPPCAFCL
jgi:hypothetical protein